MDRLKEETGSHPRMNPLFLMTQSTSLPFFPSQASIPASYTAPSEASLPSSASTQADPKGLSFGQCLGQASGAGASASPAALQALARATPNAGSPASVVSTPIFGLTGMDSASPSQNVMACPATGLPVASISETEPVLPEANASVSAENDKPAEEAATVADSLPCTSPSNGKLSSRLPSAGHSRTSKVSLLAVAQDDPVAISKQGDVTPSELLSATRHGAQGAPAGGHRQADKHTSTALEQSPEQMVDLGAAFNTSLETPLPQTSEALPEVASWMAASPDSQETPELSNEASTGMESSGQVMTANSLGSPAQPAKRWQGRGVSLAFEKMTARGDSQAAFARDLPAASTTQSGANASQATAEALSELQSLAVSTLVPEPKTHSLGLARGARASLSPNTPADPFVPAEASQGVPSSLQSATALRPQTKAPLAYDQSNSAEALPSASFTESVAFSSKSLPTSPAEQVNAERSAQGVAFSSKSLPTSPVSQINTERSAQGAAATASPSAVLSSSAEVEGEASTGNQVGSVLGNLGPTQHRVTRSGGRAVSAQRNASPEVMAAGDGNKNSENVAYKSETTSSKVVGISSAYKAGNMSVQSKVSPEFMLGERVERSEAGSWLASGLSLLGGDANVEAGRQTQAKSSEALSFVNKIEQVVETLGRGSSHAVKLDFGSEVEDRLSISLRLHEGVLHTTVHSASAEMRQVLSKDWVGALGGAFTQDGVLRVAEPVFNGSTQDENMQQSSQQQSGQQRDWAEEQAFARDGAQSRAQRSWQETAPSRVEKRVEPQSLGNSSTHLLQAKA